MSKLYNEIQLSYESSVLSSFINFNNFEKKLVLNV